MANRFNRHCAGGCGKTSVSTEGWKCWKCANKEKEEAATPTFEETFNALSPSEKLLYETNFLLSEIIMILKEHLKS